MILKPVIGFVSALRVITGVVDGAIEVVGGKLIVCVD